MRTQVLEDKVATSKHATSRSLISHNLRSSIVFKEYALDIKRSQMRDWTPTQSV